MSDGTHAELVADILWGANHGEPSHLMATDEDIYFMASTPSDGRQLWVLSKGSVSGVGEDRLQASFKLFPNPATDYIIFTYDEDTNQKISAVIIQDMLGREQLEEQKISIAHLPPGFYLLVLQVGEEQVTRKFLKVRYNDTTASLTY